MSFQLLEPILGDGVRNTHYFNGRLLTADALRADQDAHRRQRRQLGKAIGAGVVCGLEVSQVPESAPPTLRVTAGLALNREGHALELPVAQEVALARAPDEVAGEGVFVACAPPDTGVYQTGNNVYVLALAPASGYLERAPMYDLTGNGGNGVNGCGFRYVVEGVQFRLVRVDLDDPALVSSQVKSHLDDLMAAGDAASLSRLRNLLAHLCLGTLDTPAVIVDFFAHLDPARPPTPHGLLDRITSDEDDVDLTTHLNHCDVPLALIYWTPAGVQFVDLWAVRRRVTRRAPASAGMPALGDRGLAAGEAAFLQFQAQVAHLIRPGVPQSVLDATQARDYFDYLPPVGVLPLTGIGSARGFDYATFFEQIPVSDPVHIEGARLASLIRQSFAYPPVPTHGEVTMFWLYHIRENQQALTGAGSGGPQPCLVFSSGYLPFQGDARGDLNRYEYANYGIIDRHGGTILGV